VGKGRGKRKRYGEGGEKERWRERRRRNRGRENTQNSILNKCTSSIPVLFYFANFKAFC
jgi:hypothetical protein